MKGPALSIQIAGGQIFFGRIFSSQKQVGSCSLSSSSGSRKSPHTSGERHRRSNDNTEGFSSSSEYGVMLTHRLTILPHHLTPLKHQREKSLLKTFFPGSLSYWNITPSALAKARLTVSGTWRNPLRGNGKQRGEQDQLGGVQGEDLDRD